MSKPIKAGLRASSLAEPLIVRNNGHSALFGTVKAAHLDCKAEIFNEVHPRFCGDLGGLPGDQAQLQPKRFCPDCRRLPRRGFEMFLPAKNIDYVDDTWHIGERVITCESEHFVYIWVDGNHLVTLGDQCPCYAIAGPGRVCGESNHRDAAGVTKNLLD